MKQIYIILNQAHARAEQNPMIQEILPNILDFMRMIQGGSVVVSFYKKRVYSKTDPKAGDYYSIKYMIDLVCNGPSIARMTGEKEVRDYVTNEEGIVFGTVGVGGNFKMMVPEKEDE